jgi:YD repeat-containing protein
MWRLVLLILVLGSSARFALGQEATPADLPNDSVRVSVTLNQDGSRTSYRFDPTNHKATATTTDPAGKWQSKIEYELDEAGRFGSDRIYGPDGKFQFRSIYKYDSANHLLEESKFAKDNHLLGRIVFSSNGSGKQTGYAVYDSNGKLIGQTSPVGSAPSAKPKKPGN